MNIIDWIKENIFTSEEMDSYETESDNGYVAPNYRADHESLLFTYVERYINSLNPDARYDVKEELKSGRIITHLEDVNWRQARDYTRMIWIASSPPNIIISKVW